MNEEETRRTEGGQNGECFPAQSLPVPKSPVLRARRCSTFSEPPSQNPLPMKGITTGSNYTGCIPVFHMLTWRRGNTKEEGRVTKNKHARYKLGRQAWIPDPCPHVLLITW